MSAMEISITACSIIWSALGIFAIIWLIASGRQFFK